MDNGKKSTPKVLTTNNIRESARCWTLAGDVGLLAHLEQFSENIINKTQETQKNFNELVNNYEELYAKVSNITNQFLALQNCQFVENRVYDEETPTEERPEVKVQDEAEREKLLLTQYKEAVEVGIKLLDTHFEEVQLPPNSDSDDEDEVSVRNSVIWKPRNPYTSKKFPFLIGSAEWWADDHVGLRVNEEILDSEKIISESESDRESIKSAEKIMKSSSFSSMENIKSIPAKPSFMESTEDLFGFDKNETLKNNAGDDVSKGSESLFEEPTNFLPDFESEMETEKKPTQEVVKNPEEIAPNKSKKVDNEFTRELMAKLVSVTNKPETAEKEKKEEEKKPEETLPPVESNESLFDETDDSSDLFGGKISKIPEKVEGKKNLFFDAENEDELLFKGENDLFSGKNLFESDVFGKADTRAVADLESSTEPKKPEKKEGVAPKKVVNDLFDCLDDEDTLFVEKPANNKQAEKSLSSMENIKEIKPTVASGMNRDNEEGLFDNLHSEFDDDFFNSSDQIFNTKIAKVEESEVIIESRKDERKTEVSSKPEIVKPANTNPEVSELAAGKTSKRKDSFEDPFGFSQNTTRDKISILDLEEEDDLFSKGFSEDKKPPLKVLTLPDEDDDDTALFEEKPKPPDSVSVSSSRSSLFDDVSVSKSRLASVFDKDKTSKTEDDPADDSLFSGDEKPGKDLFSTKQKNSLFDDCDDGDDLFGTGKSKGKSVFERSPDKKAGKDVFGDIKRGEVESFGDDLFKTSSTNLRITKSDIFRQSKEKLFDDDVNDELFSEKPKPPSSLSLKGTKEAKGQIIGRLNIPDNLKIKFESVAKNISPGAGKPNVDEKREENLEVSDDLIQPSALLKCPSKDRVKIPGRRRPQSRRARQEAIRNSGIWDQPSPPNGSSTVQPPKESSPVVSNPLSPSTDEEDFFKVPELDKNFEKEDQGIFKSDLFESSMTSKLDDNLLFGRDSALSPHSPKKTDGKPTENSEKSVSGSSKLKTTSIFDDEDVNEGGFDGEDDENLFKSSKTTISNAGLFETPPKAEETIKKPTSGGRETQKIEEKSKKSLFDADDEDEDDLFGGESHVTSKPPPPEKLKEGCEPKSKGNSTFVDPLGLMANDE